MIQVGSNYFFSSIDGFKARDNDFFIAIDSDEFIFYKQKRINNVDYFYWNKKNILKYDYNKQPMAVAKFLIPEVLSELNLNFQQVLPILEEFLPKLKKKHEYLLSILNFYKENGEMSLTSEQKDLVFNIYNV
jgi:hypothetical protein